MPDLQITDCRCNTATATSVSPSAVSSIYHHLYEANAPLAMGYVPYQHWEEPFELCKVLHLGTIFPCLYKPFCGKGGRFR